MANLNSSTVSMMPVKHCKLKRKLAQDKKLDLVLFNDKIDPIICKVMDYRGYLYKKFQKEILDEEVFLSDLKRGQILKQD